MIVSNRAAIRRGPLRGRLPAAGLALAVACCLAAAPLAVQAQSGERVGAPIRLLPGAAPGAQPPQQQPLPAQAQPAPPAPPPGVTIPPPPAVGAQPLPPVRTVPPPAVAPTARPAPVQRAAPAPPSPAGATATSGVVMRPLGALDAASIGTLGPDSGGMPAGYWQDTPRAVVAQLLPRLPLPTQSPAVDALARRLLLSQGAVAAGDVPGQDILAARVERLLAAGRALDAAQLLKLSLEPVRDPALAGRQLDALLLAGDDDGACAVAEGMVERDSAPLWQKASAYCFARRGDRERAQLYEALLREVGTKDPAYFALLGGVLGRPGKLPESAEPLSALHLAMYRKLGAQPPAAALTGAGAAELAAVAQMRELPLEARLEPAERAAAVGALPLAELRALYEQVPTTPERRAEALAVAAAEPGPASNALLWQAARQAVDPRERAQLLLTALGNGRRLGRPLLGALTFAPLIREMQPTPAVTDFAGAAGRALLVAGDTQAAVGWFRLAVDAGRQGDAPAGRQATELWPLVQVADNTLVEYVTDVPLQWWRLKVAQKHEARFREAEVLYSLLEVLGNEVPRQLWDALYAGPLEAQGTAPSAVLVRGAAAAGAAGRSGEAALASLAMMGPGGPGALPVDALGVVVHALLAAGLERDARAIALEALIARGF